MDLLSKLNGWSLYTSDSYGTDTLFCLSWKNVVLKESHTLNGNWSLGNSHSERVGQDAFLICITNAVARVK